MEPHVAVPCLKTGGFRRKRASLVAQTVKNLPAVHETQVLWLGQEDPSKKRMATYSRILAWRIPWTEEPGGDYSPWCRKELDMTEWLTYTLFRWKNCSLLHKQQLYDSGWVLMVSAFTQQNVFLKRYVSRIRQKKPWHSTGKHFWRKRHKSLHGCLWGQEGGKWEQFHCPL